MKTRNVFSYIMWGLFAVLLSGLYYFSAIDFLNSFNILGNKYNTVIVIIVGIIIAILVFIIDKLLKKGMLTTGDKKYEVYGIIGYIIALLCFVIYRLCNAGTIISSISQSNVIDSLYKKSIIGSEGTVYLNGNSVSDLFDSVLSVSFKFLGNNAIGIFAAEFLVGLLCFILTFYSVKALYGRVEAFVVAIGMAFLPAFAIHNRDYSVYIMEYLVFAIALYFVSVSKRLFKTKYGAEIGLIISTAVIGLAVLYDSLCIGLIFLLIVLIIEDKSLNIVHKVTCIVSAIIPFSLAIIIPIAVEGYYDNSVASIGDYILDALLYRIGGVFNYKNLFVFAKSNFILIVIIACIAYVVMFLRCKFDEAHSMILLFIITLLSMCYFVKDDIIAYSLVCTMCLLCIAGSGLKKLIGFKNEDNNYDDDGTREPVIKKYDESDPDIEILDDGSEDVLTDDNDGSVEEPENNPSEEPEEEPEKEPSEEPEEEPEEETEVEPEEEPKEEPEEEPKKESEDDTEDRKNKNDNKDEIGSVPVGILPTEEMMISEVKTSGIEADSSNSDNPSWTVGTVNNEKKVELFITPLPMPKKGVKKSVNYDFEVPDNMMHFDVELNDENYFYDVV